MLVWREGFRSFHNKHDQEACHHQNATRDQDQQQDLRLVEGMSIRMGFLVGSEGKDEPSQRFRSSSALEMSLWVLVSRKMWLQKA